MSKDDPWLRPTSDGTLLRVHVRPGSSKPGIGGFHGDAVCVRVRARPTDGAANRELLSVLAEALAVAPSAVSVASGAHSRAKQVRVDGLSVEIVRIRLEPVLCVDRVGAHG